MTKKHYSIQFLRFVFSIMIVNYHFYSLFLKYNDYLPNYFCRGYLADEFFFMVSGFFIAQSSIQANSDESNWTIKYTAKRIKKIAIPYYFSWLLCFIGGRIADIIAKKKLNILSNFLNSIYELLFLEMFGFTKGLYSNSVGWYFSGLLISIMIICPLIRFYKETYLLYVAPLLGMFMLGMLSLHFDYLFWPHKIMPKLPVLKGTIRALAEINLGVFIYAIFELASKKESLKKFLKRFKYIVNLLWVIIFIYMVTPFESNFDKPSIQYDFIFTILIFLALTMTFIISSKATTKIGKFEKLENKLGICSIYIFFGQPVLYTVYQWFFSLSFRVLYKFLLYYIIIFSFSLIIYLVDKIANKFLIKISSESVSS